MRVELVIFDCDGVLVDSEPIINRAHAEQLTASGYPISAEELLDRFCGMSDMEMFAIIERDRGRPLPSSYAREVGEVIDREFRGSLIPIPGVAAAIDRLARPVCVASSSALDQIRRKLELTGLSARFGQNLFSAEMVARGKPAPDLFLYAAGRLGAAPGHCIVVEDSPAGIAAAQAAGMTAIGFSGGSHCLPGHEGRLRACGAAIVISDMRGLANAVAHLPPLAA